MVVRASGSDSPQSSSWTGPMLWDRSNRATPAGTMNWDRGQSQFIVPAGVARLLRSQSIGPVHELDWGESLPLARTTIHSVPALHFSSRGIFDRNLTLWCGYVIEYQDRLVYF